MPIYSHGAISTITTGTPNQLVITGKGRYLNIDLDTSELVSMIEQLSLRVVQLENIINAHLVNDVDD